VAAVLRVALDLAHTRQSSAGTARVARSLHAALARRGDVTVVPLGSVAVNAGGATESATTVRLVVAEPPAMSVAVTAGVAPAAPAAHE
jgi:hypothetical protein